MTIRDIIAFIIMCIGLVFILLGVFGIYKFKNFYSRILIAAKVDTVGFLIICTGVVIKKGVSWFSLKVLLLTIIVILINPVITHAIANSAYHGGYRIHREEKDVSSD